MSTADIIILIVVIALFGSILYFSFIRPKIKKQNACCKCPYSKQCSKLKKDDCNIKDKNKECETCEKTCETKSIDTNNNISKDNKTYKDDNIKGDANK